MLDLNTTAATPGPVTITITNPDGQSVAGNGILSIGSKTTPAANLVATAASTTSINLTWNAVAGAASYNILRKSQGSAYLPLTTSSVNSFTDTNLTAGTTYVYKVQAVVDDVGGPASNPDLATTILFTDDPSLSGSTRIKAIHVVESRSAVNAVRVAAGLPEFTFTDTPGPAVFVKGLHIKQLRDKLNEALAALTMPGITLTNTIADGTPVRALDVNEIRNATK